MIQSLATTRRVTGAELERLRADGAFPYQRYMAWMAEEPIQPPLFMLSSEAMPVRARCQWNTVGREVYTRDRLEWHVGHVTRALNKCMPGAMDRMLVQHAGHTYPWLPPRSDFDGVRTGLLAFLRSKTHDEAAEFRGGFVVTNDFDKWLLELSDYAYLLKYRDVVFLSLDKAIMVCAQHHLAIEIYAEDRSLLDGIQTQLASCGIHTARATSAEQ